ncbi:MAG: helix-turn-helix transcriptional regulator [Acidimicrobiales bacterium]
MANQAAEESRERLVALTLLLQNASASRPLTQETIVGELMVDAFPASSKGPRKVRAYTGSPGAVRQKFERDKARVRDLGWQIETVALADGSVGYWIDPSSATAPPLDLSEDEERVVRLALRVCGFGAAGAFSLFNDGPAVDGGLEFTNFVTPVIRALHAQRVLSFDYQSATRKTRVVEPLELRVFEGALYLIARPRGTEEVKGYRLSRMVSMPVVTTDAFVADEATRAAAGAWRPQYAKAPAPLDAVVTTNADYARLIERQYPSARRSTRPDGRVEVTIRFDSPRAALRFVLEAAERVRVEQPKSLRRDLASWLRGVNRGDVPDLTGVTFAGPTVNDVLGQTLQLLRAVHLSPDGLRVSDLAARFSLDGDLVRRIMDRLVTFEPMRGAYGFPAHVVKECDDWDHEATDDSLYRAEYYDRDGFHELAPLLWRDLVELNVALREASRIYADPAIESAIATIEAVVGARVRVTTADEAMLGEIVAAAENHEQLKIEYSTADASESETRTIEPREVRVLNGHTYVRAYCTSREGWRTFRVDRIGSVLARSPATLARPVDDHPQWLTEVGEGGEEVVVVIDPSLRWLFEPLPHAQWSALGDGRHAVRFRVRDRSFLDHLMVRAGEGAVVATTAFADAGRDLAARIARQ